MKIASKALGSSIIIMLSFSFIVSLLLYGVFNVTYSDRHEYCQQVQISAQANCETREEMIRLTLRNDGSRDMYYEINSKIDSVYDVILPGTMENPQIEKESEYKIIPHVKGDDGKLYSCIQQTQYVSSSEVPECN